MVLHGEKTLKTTIQKNLWKPQKFARKAFVVEFRYSQPIFLQFTVIALMILKLMILWNFIWKLNLLLLEEGLRSFPPLGLHKEILDSPCLLILLIYTEHKRNKMKSWTHLRIILISLINTRDENI